MSEQESGLKGRGVSAKTKEKILKLKSSGLYTNAEIADLLTIGEYAVERALRVDLCKFTDEEVRLIQAALGYMRGRKDRTFHDSRDFDQVILAMNEADDAGLKALYERVLAYGLKTD